LNWCEQHGADIVIVDYMMPAPDGIEVVKRIARMPHMRDVPVIMITANDQKQVRVAALESGATDFLNKPVDKSEFIARIRNMATMRRSQRLLSDRAALLSEEVAQATRAIIERERDTIVRLSRAAEYRDPETGNHILRMAHIAKLVGAQMGLSAADQNFAAGSGPHARYRQGGHPRSHPAEAGAAQSRRIFHHEAACRNRLRHPQQQPFADTRCGRRDRPVPPRKVRWQRLSAWPARQGNSLFSRIVAVSDVFDALTSARPYKRAWELDRARDFLIDNSGNHFDPDCVDAFLKVWDEVLRVREQIGIDHCDSDDFNEPSHP
jgi:putative two-component system response regulator